MSTIRFAQRSGRAGNIREARYAAINGLSEEEVSKEPSCTRVRFTIGLLAVAFVTVGVVICYRWSVHPTGQINLRARAIIVEEAAQHGLDTNSTDEDEDD